MDADPRSGREILSESECFELLGTQRLGRLAVAVGGKPDIFPVNYIVVERQILFRTAEGSKLASLAVNEAVAFEVDGFLPEEHKVWSVVLRGHSRIIANDDEAAALEKLPLVPWVISDKVHFVEVSVSDISGRRYLAGGKPKE